MMGQKRFWQTVPLLLVSSVLALGQTSGTASPGWPTRQSASNTQIPPAAQVGPGTINYLEGNVMLDGQPLTTQLAAPAVLRPGSTLETSQNGFAEVLLTPGAFLRVGPNSQVRMDQAGLVDTRAEVVHGTSLLEVDQLIKGATLSVQMGTATVRMEKAGLYRYDANQNSVMVLNGKADVQEPNGTRTLEGHDQVLLASDNPLKKRGFDEKLVKAEPLYVWSLTRSQAESQASNYAASNASAYYVAGPGWFWDPYWNFYGFWPADAMLYSPFGWGFYSPVFFGFGYYGGYYYGGHYITGHYYLAHPGQYAVASRAVAGTSVHANGYVRTMSGGFHGGFGGGFHGGGGRR